MTSAICLTFSCSISNKRDENQHSLPLMLRGFFVYHLTACFGGWPRQVTGPLMSSWLEFQLLVLTEGITRCDRYRRQKMAKEKQRSEG